MNDSLLVAGVPKPLEAARRAIEPAGSGGNENPSIRNRSAKPAKTAPPLSVARLRQFAGKGETLAQ